MLEARAFEPDFLRRLDGLVLGVQRSRTVREGRRMLGRVQGLGIEPESFKEYTEGDDLRFLDWNAFARLDDLTIRTFRAEREIEVSILVDASASMGLPREDDKLGFALALAASLAYVAMASNDAVRLGAFTAARDGTPRLETSALHRRRESYPAFRTFVGTVRASGATQMAEAMGRLLLMRRPAGTVILISDFWSPPATTNRLCEVFCARATRSRSSTSWAIVRATALIRRATIACAIRKPASYARSPSARPRPKPAGGEPSSCPPILRRSVRPTELCTRGLSARAISTTS